MTIGHGGVVPSVAFPVLFAAQGNGLVFADRAYNDDLNVMQRASQSATAAAVNRPAA
jgi:hypothetical protein